MLSKPSTMDGAVKRPLQLGDILDSLDLPIVSVTNSTTDPLTLTAAQVVPQDVLTTGGSANTNTLPTADAICAALRGAMGINVPPANSAYGPDVAPTLEFSSNLGIIPPGSTFRRIFRNANSGTMTLAAPATSGVAISGTATVATSVWREYVVRILASAPTSIFSCTTTDTTKNLTNVPADQIRRLQVGQSVYGTGIGSAAVIDSINYDTNTVHVTVASTATADNIAVTATPTVTFTNLRAGSV